MYPRSQPSGNRARRVCFARRAARTKNVAVFFLDAPPRVPEKWRLLQHLEMHQMICHTPPTQTSVPDSVIEPLGDSDIPQMRQLAEATEPRPFSQPHHRIRWLSRHSRRQPSRLHDRPAPQGSGIHGGQRSLHLSRIQGTRLRTSPRVDSLSRHLCTRETPILGVRLDNSAAVRVYKRAGFTIRRNLHVVVVKKPL